MKLISFVFSFKNEEKNLEELIKRVDNSVKKLSNYDYELIFVNDESDDNSEKLFINLQKKFSDYSYKYVSDIWCGSLCFGGF